MQIRLNQLNEFWLTWNTDTELFVYLTPEHSCKHDRREKIICSYTRSWLCMYGHMRVKCACAQVCFCAAGACSHTELTL